MSAKKKFRVEMRQSIISIETGKTKNPWFWCILTEGDHTSCSSKDSFNTLSECLDDFSKNGVKSLEFLENNES